MRSHLAAILLLALAALTACNAGRSAPATQTRSEGVLMSWDSSPMPEAQESDRELLEMFVRTWQRLPADVKVESLTDRAAVLTLDMAKAGAAMAGRGSQAEQPPIPVRLIAEIDRADGARVLRTRQYYLGSDPEILAEIQSNVEHARESGNTPPQH